MSLLSAGRSGWVVSALLSAGCVRSLGQTATVRGAVRDAQGYPVSGASMELTCDADPGRSAQGRSTAQGAFLFKDLLPCQFNLSAAFTGSASAPVVVSVAGAESVERDLVLLPIQATIDTAVPLGKPRFEASGIRGLIDPGGYSAPANAAAASGMLSGMADVKRQNAARSVRLPCAAEAELTRAVTQQPGSVIANRRLGEFYLDHADNERALPPLTTALQGDPKDLDTRLDLAEAALGLQRFEQAQAQLAAIPDGQQSVRLHRLRAKSDEGLGQFRLASNEYLQLNRSEPNEGDAFSAGYEAVLDGRPADAEAIFGEALLRYPRSVSLLIGEGTAEFLEGHAPDAVERFVQAAELDPADPRPYPFLAEVSSISSVQAARALAATRQHVQREPDDAAGLLAYASMLKADEGRAPHETEAQVRSLLERAIALQPGLSQAHFQLGVFYLRGGRAADAVREFRMVLRVEPSRSEAHYRLSLALRKTGDVQAADRELAVFQQDRANRDTAVNTDLRQFLSVVQSPHAPQNADTCSNVQANPSTAPPSSALP